MRLRSRGRDAPRAKTIRPAERYLTAGASEARRLGCSFVGTEHVLLALVRDDRSAIVPLLARLDVDPGAVERALARWLGAAPERTKIDPAALATLGIDFDAVRATLEQTFGPGALERSRASCLGIAPRLKLALAHALDVAGDRPLADEHVLLGMLSVPASVAARALATLDVSFEDVNAVLAREAHE
jgi:ATP-dependent Clp protease ATP-binding subunit ClpA